MAAAGAMAGAMGTVAASKYPASAASTASATSAKSNLTTTVSVHHNNINVDKVFLANSIEEGNHDLI